MFFIQRPSELEVERFIHTSRELPLSYDPVGLVHRPAMGFNADDAIVAIGRGKGDFERAKAALVEWKQFGIGWVELFPPAASIEPGTIVAVLIHHLGFWSLNGCQVVYTVGDRDAHIGYAYGTLTNHAESGEELFEVVLDPDSEKVIYRIRAVSRPRVALTQIGYPIARWLQARFRRDSALAMMRAVGRTQG